MSLFQSNLRGHIRTLPKILKSDSVKIIHYHSLSFIRVLNRALGDALAQQHARPLRADRDDVELLREAGDAGVPDNLGEGVELDLSNCLTFRQTLKDSFSAVPKPIFASK